MISPMQLIQLIKNGYNPQQLVMNIVQNQGQTNNPILNNAMSLAQKGDISNLENLARNLASQRGLNFDTEFSSFKQQLGL